MLVMQLIEQLSQLPQTLEVTILDGFNGGGIPRDINLTPHVYDPKEWEWTTNKERDDYSDIHTPTGQPIVVMGYGCY